MGLWVREGGRRHRRAIQHMNDVRQYHAMNCCGKRTRGGLIYSTALTLFLLLTEPCTSFAKLYLSTLKLNVGPFDSLTILSEGATSVSVSARRCVTCSAGAIVKKSFSLFRAR